MLSPYQVPSQIEEIADSSMGSHEPLSLKIHINHITILIHGSPQIVLLTIYLDEDFINEECIAIATVLLGICGACK